MFDLLFLHPVHACPQPGATTLVHNGRCWPAHACLPLPGASSSCAGRTYHSPRANPTFSSPSPASIYHRLSFSCSNSNSADCKASRGSLCPTVMHHMPPIALPPRWSNQPCPRIRDMGPWFLRQRQTGDRVELGGVAGWHGPWSVELK